MANQKISAMPDATLPLSGDELVPIVQGGENRRAPARSLDREIIQLSCSDLTTPLMEAGSVGYVRAARKFTLTEIRASLLNESSSGQVEIDILKNGVSILSTPLTIDEGETTSKTAGTAVVIDDPDVEDDDMITVNIDDPGTDATGLVVTLIGTPA